MNIYVPFEIYSITRVDFLKIFKMTVYREDVQFFQFNLFPPAKSFINSSFVASFEIYSITRVDFLKTFKMTIFPI